MQRQYLFDRWSTPKLAVITGASSGMGKEFAKQLATQYFNLVLIARRKEKLEELKLELEAKYQIQAKVVQCDLSDPAQIHALLTEVEELSFCDFLVNAAGFGTLGYFLDKPYDSYQRMLNLHVEAPLRLIYHILPKMIQRRRGVIINIASIGAFTPIPGNVIYNSTKSFLIAFSDNLQLELRETPIKVQALCPGFTLTEFHEVGDYHNHFRRSSIPKSLWASAEKVVSESLSDLSTQKVVMIPRGSSRFIRFLFRIPFIRVQLQRKFAKKPK